MQTWLDEYIRFSADTWDLFMEMTKKAAGAYLKVESTWEKAMLWNRIAFMTEESIRVLAPGAENLYPPDIQFFQRLYTTLFQKLSPHAYATFEQLANKAIYYLGNYQDPLLARGPINFQLAPDLAEDFHGAKAPDTESWRDIFDEHIMVYLDFPPGTYVWDEHFEVRAVFATNDVRNENDLRATWMRHGEPLIAPGFPKLNVMVVLMERGKLSLDNVFQFGFAEGEPWSFYGGLPQWNARYIANEGKDPVAAFSTTMEQVMDLLKLAILYHQTRETPAEYLPSTTPEKVEALRNPKKQKARLKQFTLFKVARLASPKGRFGRTDQQKKPAGGYKLDHRVPVRGHFRMQPHGPGKTLRRLQWIEGFERGPKDTTPNPGKQTLHVLRKETP